jgi:murein DD-endopeptidase MepM/ murein hydrolase activator NlpD
MAKKSFIKEIFTKRITFMVIPHQESSNVFQVRMPLLAALLCLAVIIGAFSYAAYIINQDIDYKLAQESVKSLKEKVSLYNDEFIKVKEKADNLAKKEKALREMLGYKSKSALVEGSGAGGPSRKDQNVLENMLSSEIGKDDVKSTTEDMLAELELREQSIKQVEKYVSNLRSLDAATPKGLPIHGMLTSKWGYREMVLDYMGNTGKSNSKEFHAGLDIANSTGTPIKATAFGKVIFSGTLGGYGQLVILQHGYDYSTRYAHCSKLLVKKGDEVKRGDTIALVGRTGNSTGPHVHYEVRRYGKALDPEVADPRIFARR